MYRRGQIRTKTGTDPGTARRVRQNPQQTTRRLLQITRIPYIARITANGGHTRYLSVILQNRFARRMADMRSGRCSYY